MLLDGRADLEERRVALLVPPGRHYVVAQWTTWLAGGVTVPLCLTHPPAEMTQVLSDSGVDVLVVPDDEWGERVAVAVKWRAGAGASLDDLRAWCKERLAAYKVPSRLLTVPELPRNAMGKVVKKEVAALFAASG